MSTLPLFVVVLMLAVLSVGCAAPVVTNLKAEARDGQVFLTWDEPAGWLGRLTVVSSATPLTDANVAQAAVLGHHISPGSANDWWLNPETYGNPLAVDPATGQKPPIPRDGWLLTPGGQRLNPAGGLFVHTLAADEGGPRYYAVLSQDEAGVGNQEVVTGANALAQPVTQQPAPVVPIWQNTGAPPDPALGKGKPLHLILHAKTGRGGMDWLVFGDRSLGWREGLPFKFGVRITADAVEVSTTDRTWIDRMFPEGLDGCQKLTPAIHSFWYGYNDRIYDPAQMKDGTVVNFTERRLLWILDWVQRTYQTDPNRIYEYGSSMGGCGSISFALRHPELIAGIRAHVPIVAYDKGTGGDSAMRMVKETGGLEMPTNEGMSAKDRLDGTKFVREHPGDLPFLVIVNGRKDASIPWWKCPDFFRAMRDGRHGMIAAWDNGDHGGCGKDLPPDVKAWNDLRTFHKLIALNLSYPAFSNSSRDENPGNGTPADGDIVGFFGRGFTWEAPVESATKYEVLLRWALEADKLPVTVDVTPRRVQAFKPQPGQQVTATNLAADSGQEVQKLTVTVDEAGRITVPGFRLTSAAGNRLVLTLAP